jgi:hypothetical protein
MPGKCKSALFIGCLLLLLAAAALLLSATADSHASASRQLEVHQAVVNLQGQCPTCHSAQSDQSALIAFAPGLAVHEGGGDRVAAPAAVTPPAQPAQAALNTRLLEVGTRILDAPQTSSAEYETAVDAYLRVYEASRSETTPASLLESLRQLAEIQQLLITVENQAQPNQWQKEPHSLESPDLAAASSAPSSPVPSVAYVQTTILSVSGEHATLPEHQVHGTWQSVTFALHRRGPPAGVPLESVCVLREIAVL